jgi:hypothetical protein
MHQCNMRHDEVATADSRKCRDQRRASSVIVDELEGYVGATATGRPGWDLTGDRR